MVVWAASIGSIHQSKWALYPPWLCYRLEEAFFAGTEWIEYRLPGQGTQNSYWINTKDLFQQMGWQKKCRRKVVRAAVRCTYCGSQDRKPYVFALNPPASSGDLDPWTVNLETGRLNLDEKHRTIPACTWDMQGYLTSVNYGTQELHEAYPIEDEDEAYIAMQETSKGKMVLDSGATTCCGSVVALEALQRMRVEKEGNDGVASFDPEDNQRFKFGNGEAQSSLGRADLRISSGGEEGQVSVQVLETKGRYVPMLGSVKLLRDLGAVVDFDQDEAIFKKVDPNKVVQLERASSGHLLLDLQKDLSEQMGSRPRTGQDLIRRVDVGKAYLHGEASSSADGAPTLILPATDAEESSESDTASQDPSAQQDE